MNHEYFPPQNALILLTLTIFLLSVNFPTFSDRVFDCNNVLISANVQSDLLSSKYDLSAVDSAP